MTELDQAVLTLLCARWQAADEIVEYMPNVVGSGRYKGDWTPGSSGREGVSRPGRSSIGSQANFRRREDYQGRPGEPDARGGNHRPIESEGTRVAKMTVHRRAGKPPTREVTVTGLLTPPARRLFNPQEPPMDVTKAAERLRWFNENRHQQWTLGSWDTEYVACLTKCAAAYLAEHPADDAEPIDGPWLRSVGAVKEDHPDKWTFRREDALDVGLWHVDDGWKAMLLYGECAASCIRRGLKTRGDVRRLAAALGIQLATP